MANTEQIEAKLCAYIDGELDDAARAEIEQHLIEHPQHRELLAELIAQRQLVRGLSREKAPEDLFESFQTQLERSVLLNADAASAADTGRRSRWPQMFALAAVLILACGLAAVIILVVLPDRHKSASVAMSPPLASSTTSPTPTAGFASRRVNNESAAIFGGGVNSGAPAASQPSEDRPPASIQQSIAAKPSGIFNARYSANGSTAGAYRVLDNQLDPAIVRKLKENKSVPNDAMLLVVASSDPPATNQQMTDYLAAHKIHWQALPEPMAQPVNLPRDRDVMSKPGMAIAEKLTTEAAARQKLQEFQGHASSPPAGEVLAEQVSHPLSLTSQPYVVSGILQQNPGEPNMIVVRNLTQKQLTDLNQHIARVKDYQVTRYVRSGPDVRLATINAGSEPQRALHLAASTRATSFASALADQVENGLEKAAEIAQPMRDERSIASTHQVPSTMPGTRSTTLAATIPATAPSATQPIANVNMVICVVPQSQADGRVNSSETPATQPTTQATTAPATTQPTP